MEELQEALVVYIKTAQKKQFQDEIKSREIHWEIKYYREINWPTYQGLYFDSFIDK